MCGICGELRFDGAPADLGAVARMMERLQPRGPDHGGSYSDGALAFGHRRLSIIDLSARSNQPMVDQALGLALVFNGTIYNYPELRRELRDRGYSFFSDGDTEVILKAWHAWGEDCVERLHGMFAFAIWDSNRRQLFLARDRFGIKPLYWSEANGRLRFASTTQALVAAGGISAGIDPVALHNLFTLHAVVPAPRTILSDVRKLPPAHWLRIDADGRQTEQRYWQLEATRGATGSGLPSSDAEWVEAIHDALEAAVRKRREIADVPVGVLLSGGLDSSLLVALLAEHGVGDLHTFSVGFEDTPEEAGSEFEYSDQVVAHFGTRHHRFRVANDEVLRRLPEAVDAMTEPMFGQDAVAFYLLAEQVARETKVVQSGQGADEVFGGYFWYPRIAADTEGAPVDRVRRHYFDRDHDEYLRMVAPAYAGPDHTGAYVAERLAEPGADEVIDALLRLDVTTLIVDDPVKRVDNQTMAWGLEARVPFLDHELVEFAARVPSELKVKGDGKYLLKEAARSIIPSEVIDRPKGYFPVPALKYISGPYLDLVKDVLLQPAAKQRALVQEPYLERLLKEPAERITPLQGSKLWQVALLELWLQEHEL